MSARFLLLALVVVVAGCGTASALTPAPAVTPTPSATPTASPTVAPTATPTPEPTGAPLSPDAMLELWKSAFAANQDYMKTDVADAIEADFFWIDSIDRTTYDPERHLLRWDASIDYESVYRNDLAEWKADTWELYRAFARDIWGPFTEGFGEDSGMDPDWPTWTPRVRLDGNDGRLTVDCPGSLIYAITLREATQAEFNKQCKFKTLTKRAPVRRRGLPDRVVDANTVRLCVA